MASALPVGRPTERPPVDAPSRSDPPTRFAAETAVERLAPGRYAGSMYPSWWIVNGPNGGYVAAVVLRAIVAEVADPARRPRTLTMHYLRAPAAGPVEVHFAQAGKFPLVAPLDPDRGKAPLSRGAVCAVGFDASIFNGNVIGDEANRVVDDPGRQPRDVC